MSKNVAMFVDVANLYYAARGQDVDVDYVALLKHATKGRDLIRAYAYTGLDPENENQRKFIDFLAKNGYKPVVKDIRKFGDGRMKANLDIELVVDLFRLADRMDIAVVVSGDGDFAPAIRALQDKGVRAEVISFKPNTSSDLIAVADEFMDIMKIASISRKEARTARDTGMSAPEMPAKEVTPEFGFREASPSVAAAALAAIKTGRPPATGVAPAAARAGAGLRRPRSRPARRSRRDRGRRRDDRGGPSPSPPSRGTRPRPIATRGDDDGRGRRGKRGGRGRLGGVRRPQPARRARGRSRVQLRGGRCRHPRRARDRSRAGRPVEAEAPAETDEKPKRRARSTTKADPDGDEPKPKTRSRRSTAKPAAEAESPAETEEKPKRRARSTTKAAPDGDEPKPKTRSRRSTAKPAAEPADAEGASTASASEAGEPQGIWGRFRSARPSRPTSTS